MLELSERFLQEEQANSGGRFDPVDRARFHRIVRLCAENWLRHPQASLRIARSKAGLVLHFEGPMTGRLVPVFHLKVDYKSGSYHFAGPFPERRKSDLETGALEALERLRDLYEAFLAADSSPSSVIDSELKGKPFPDLVPLVEESRRILDGGFDGAQPPPPPPRKKDPPVVAVPTPPAAASPTPPSTPSPTDFDEDDEDGDDHHPPPPVAPAKAPKPPPASKSKKPTAKPAVKETPMTTQATETTESAALAFGDAPLVRLVLHCADAKESAAFYRRIFGVKSEGKPAPGVHAAYRLGGVELVLKDDFTNDERRLLGVGSVTKNRGWGAIFVLQIPEFQSCLRRIKRVQDALVRADTEAKTLMIRDPSGYLLELVEA